MWQIVLRPHRLTEYRPMCINNESEYGQQESGKRKGEFTENENQTIIYYYSAKAMQ